MGGASSMHGEMGNVYKNSSRNSEQKGYLRDLDVDRGDIKLDFK
jgi:hypothetical protein